MTELTIPSPIKDYKGLFQSLPGLYLLLAPDAPRFTIIDANEAFCKSTYTNQSEIIGMGLFEAFPDNPENPETTGVSTLSSSLEYVVRQKSPHHLVDQKYDVYNPFLGRFEERYWGAHNQPLFDEKGNITAIIHSVTDVTEQVGLKKNKKRAIKYALKQREQLLSFFEQAPVAISILTGPNFQVEFANPKICEIWGKPHGEILKKPLFEIIPETKSQGFDRLLKRVMETGNSVTGFEVPANIKRNNEFVTLYLNLVWSPMEGPDGDIDGIFVIATDVTEQVLIRKRIEENEQRLNLALEVSKMGVFDFCLLGNYLSRNQKFDEIFGPAQENDWDLAKLRQLLHPDDRFNTTRVLVKALKQQGKFFLQCRIQKSDGSINWIEVQGKIFRNDKGRAIRVLGSVTDISERKELERHKDEFMGIVSHELKTPVTSLKAYTQLLEQKLQKEGDFTSAMMLHKMDSQINKLTKLIVDLLDATKIEAGKLLMQCEPFDLQQLIDEVVEEVQRTSLKHRIVKDNLNKVMIAGDKERIGQVITNFLTNAIKYSPQSDTIKIDAIKQGGHITCCVTDYGMGIQPQYLDKVFNRFFRINENRRNMIPGLGLGMYISSEIIKRHNGEIWAESEEEKGSTFYFKLPLIES